MTTENKCEAHIFAMSYGLFLIEEIRNWNAWETKYKQSSIFESGMFYVNVR